ncbi:hypothetical protein [Streptomyces sp. JH34]|uniref:hypothetical protein n=1 Tax=Streptomyces sp. JH34 TaxID=2793633 RepID=UPI0023F6787E|nr:hypothetical protein [Streptomyces sp. JH34]MDF6022586.1 hypothetical protein [Streptomyces sp. JH34]
MTLDEVWGHLVQDEWELALGVLEEVGDAPPPPLACATCPAGSAAVGTAVVLEARHPAARSAP